MFTAKNRINFLTIFLLFAACTAQKKGYEFSEETCVIFKEDPFDKDVPFEPTVAEVEAVEKEFRAYLQKSKTDTINYPISQKDIPLEEELSYYKRRCFGRENIEGEKVIKVQYIFNRCISPQDRAKEQWKNINYLERVDSTCWFSFQYNMERREIYGL